MLLALVISAAVLFTVLVIVRRPDGAIDKAARLLEDDRGFATAEEAGATFTRVSIVLQVGGEACLEGDPRAGECDHLFAAAAYARVSAVSLLGCTRRGTAQGRTTLRTYLVALERDPALPLPPVPACRN